MVASLYLVSLVISIFMHFFIFLLIASLSLTCWGCSLYLPRGQFGSRCATVTASSSLVHFFLTGLAAVLLFAATASGEQPSALIVRRELRIFDFRFNVTEVHIPWCYARFARPWIERPRCRSSFAVPPETLYSRGSFVQGDPIVAFREESLVEDVRLYCCTQTAVQGSAPGRGLWEGGGDLERDGRALDSSWGTVGEGLCGIAGSRASNRSFVAAAKAWSRGAARGGCFGATRPDRAWVRMGPSRTQSAGRFKGGHCPVGGRGYWAADGEQKTSASLPDLSQGGRGVLRPSEDDASSASRIRS